MPLLSRWRKAALAAIVALVGGASVYQYGPALQLLPPTNVTVNAPAAGGYTDAEGALWVVASGGATSGSCPVGTPCTMAYALSSVSSGGTIIVNSGTYSGSVTLSGASHQNVTITAPAAVKNALTWTCGSTWIPAMSAIHAPTVATDCGIVSGTDNRPYWSSGDWDISATGVTVDHLRMQQDATPSNGWCTYFTISVTGVTVSRSEIRNGCTIVALTNGAKGVRLVYNYIHTGGGGNYPTCGGIDSHGIAVYDFGGATAAATSFGSATSTPTATTGLVVSHNTLTDMEGDGMQELGMYDGGAAEAYLIQEYNHVYENCEQGLDYKGTQNVIIRYNDVHTNNYGGISTNDEDGAVNYAHLDWWIYGNLIHDQDNFGLYSQQTDDGRWMIWNNIFYANCQNPQYNWSAFSQPPPNSRVEHNLFWDNNRTAGNAAGGLTSDAAGSSVIVRNNIFYNNGTGSTGNIYSGSNATITNNRCYPTSPGTCGSGAETNAASDFTSLSVPYDFHLATGAQSIDAGTTLTANDANHTILIDLDGETRPVNSVFDHGPYEYLGAPPVASRMRLSHLLAALWRPNVRLGR